MNTFEAVKTLVEKAKAAVESAAELVDNLPSPLKDKYNLWLFLDSHKNDLDDTLDRIQHLRERHEASIQQKGE